MRENITRDFIKAEEKGLNVYYNHTSGEFEIETLTERISFYDDEDGNGIKETKEFIENF